MPRIQTKYLQLAADYTQFPLKNEFDDFVPYDTELLPTDLVAKISSWNDRYKKLLPLNCTSDVRMKGAILDQEGELLANKVEEHFAGGVKVRHLSAL